MSTADKFAIVALIAITVLPLSKAIFSTPFSSISMEDYEYPPCRSTKSTSIATSTSQGKNCLICIPPSAIQSLQSKGYCVLSAEESGVSLQILREARSAIKSDIALFSPPTARDGPVIHGADDPPPPRSDIRSMVDIPFFSSGLTDVPSDVPPASALHSIARLLASIPLAVKLSNSSSTEAYTRTSSHEIPSSLQVAVYPPPSHSHPAGYYVPHRDNPRVGPAGKLSALGLVSYLESRHYKSRVLTAIVYLTDFESCGLDGKTEGWSEAKHGGSLRLYPSYAFASSEHLASSLPSPLSSPAFPPSAPPVVVIPPQLGTIVIFDSTTILHEVTAMVAAPEGEAIEGSRDRVAVTIWLTGRRDEQEFGGWAPKGNGKDGRNPANRGFAERLVDMIMGTAQ